MRFAFSIAALLVAGTCFAQGPQLICQDGRCWQAPVILQQAVIAAPQQIYVPQVTYQPYQLQSTQVQERVYRTPLRNLLFGKYRVQHQYAPVQQ